MSFQPIENYGVIGNMRSIALVGMNGSIDFLCYPEFDFPTIFAALLDEDQGGRFQIEPRLTNARIRQQYLPDTNILLTRFLAEEGVAGLTDYIPIEQDAAQPNQIIRTISVIRGNVHFEMRCQPRFKLGSLRPSFAPGAETFPVGAPSTHGSVAGMKFETTSLSISGMTGYSRLCSQKEHKK
jgi:GH15 family glucan-1,4-alpha-glucosidase